MKPLAGLERIDFFFNGTKPTITRHRLFVKRLQHNPVLITRRQLFKFLFGDFDFGHNRSYLSVRASPILNGPLPPTPVADSGAVLNSPYDTARIARVAFDGDDPGFGYAPYDAIANVVVSAAIIYIPVDGVSISLGGFLNHRTGREWANL